MPRSNDTLTGCETYEHILYICFNARTEFDITVKPYVAFAKVMEYIFHAVVPVEGVTMSSPDKT